MACIILGKENEARNSNPKAADNVVARRAVI
jgi:hypothetical protein